MKFQFFCFGTLYHPERYPHDAETLAEDVALMRQLHMNVALISSGAVRYAMSVGGGDAWLCGILDALGGAGVSAGIEIQIPETLPPQEMLQKLDRDERVLFFKAASCKPGKALQTARALRSAGLKKPVSLQIQEKDLFSGLIKEDDADILCFSHAPEWTRGIVMERAGTAAFLEDRVRTVINAPFFLTGVDPVRIRSSGCGKLRPPKTLQMELLQAAIHGARGCFFRDFRQARSGEERYEGAVISHSGKPDKRHFEEIEQVGRLLGEMQGMLQTKVASRCALMCGEEERGTAYRLYKAIRSLGVSVDILASGEAFERYHFVASAGMRRVSEEMAERIRSFVEKGGIWLAGFGFATEDPAGICFTGDVPHGMTDVFGIRVLETEGLYPDEEIPLQTTPDFKGKHHVKRIQEIAQAEEADVVARYDGGSFRGCPALVRKAFGDGFAYYLAADCDDGLLKILCDKILKSRKGIARVKMPEGISVQRLADKEAEYLVFQNFTDREKRLPLDYNKLDILFGYDPVPVCGVLVLRVPRKKGGREEA